MTSAGSGYGLDPAQLDQVAKNMLNTNETLVNALKTMGNELEPLKSAWKGQAATVFNSLVEEFLSDANTLNQSLDQIANTVSSNSKAYLAQEQEQAQSMNSIASTLGGF